MFLVLYRYILPFSHIPTPISLHIMCTTDEYATHTLVSLTPIIHSVTTLIPPIAYVASHPVILVILLVPRRITTPLIFKASPAKKIDLPKDDSACRSGNQECTPTIGSLIIPMMTHPTNIPFLTFH